MSVDIDTDALGRAVNALGEMTPELRKAALEYLWDRFVLQPIRDAAKACPDCKTTPAAGTGMYHAPFCKWCGQSESNHRDGIGFARDCKFEMASLRHDGEGGDRG